MNPKESKLPEDRHVIFGAFKGFGDLLSAAPAMIYELNKGNAVTLLIFPVLASFIPLLDFGPNAHRLTPVVLPVSPTVRSIREFARAASKLSPDIVWISPHAVKAAASWKIPMLVFLLRKLYWRRTVLACATTEPLSHLFDLRIPINRNLPLLQREWTAYSLATGINSDSCPAPATFINKLSAARTLEPLHDVVFHPGASWINKKWPHNFSLELIARLTHNLRVVILGLKHEIEPFRSLLTVNDKLIIATASIEDALMIFARSKVAVTMDSGGMHFATTLGLPTLALFGPTDPHAILQPSPLLTALYEPKLECQPCFKPQCNQKAVYCMQLLSPRIVEQRVRELLVRNS